MRTMRRGMGVAIAVVLVIVALGVAAGSAGAATFSWIKGYDDPATPDQYDQVGILKEGPPTAKKILVLVPGTSAGATQSLR